MATRTIARLFDSYSDASAAVRDLEAAGFAHDDVSLIANRGDETATTAGGTTTTDTEAASGTGAGTGATLGTIVGGGAGLLAGIGALAIPGLGPIVAAGWLVAAVTGAGVGAAAGGLLGALAGAGLSEEESHVYAEGVRRGGNLVTVRADEARAAEAEAIMARHNAVNTDERSATWREGGWSRFDETADPASGIGTAAGVGTTTAAAQMGMRTDASLVGGPPDGTPGNPKGTMVSRGIDDALGTNISGARPENEGRHAGTRDRLDSAPDDAVGRNLARAPSEGQVPTGLGAGGLDAPDGTPGNPPCTKLSRAADDALGTNMSGARPENEKGATGNRPAGSATGDIRPERPPQR